MKQTDSHDSNSYLANNRDTLDTFTGQNEFCGSNSQMERNRMIPRRSNSLPSVAFQQHLNLQQFQLDQHLIQQRSEIQQSNFRDLQFRQQQQFQQQQEHQMEQQRQSQLLLNEHLRLRTQLLQQQQIFFNNNFL